MEVGNSLLESNQLSEVVQALGIGWIPPDPLLLAVSVDETMVDGDTSRVYCGCDMKHKLYIPGQSVAIYLSISHVQWEGGTALMQASDGGHLGVVKELVGAQASVDEQDEVCSL